MIGVLPLEKPIHVAIQMSPQMKPSIFRNRNVTCPSEPVAIV